MAWLFSIDCQTTNYRHGNTLPVFLPDMFSQNDQTREWFDGALFAIVWAGRQLSPNVGLLFSNCSVSREPAYSDEQVSEFGLRRDRLARHIAIIMDGNGRWAQKRSLPRIEGHRRGVHSVRAIVEECSRLGLEQLTLYCFSSENWKRPKLELNLLMKLLRRYLVEERKQIQEQGLRFKVIGRTDELDPAIQKEIAITEEVARENTGMMLCLAVNYGARLEITEAVQSLAQQVKDGTLNPEDITEESVAANLMTAGMPDPDLVIRTANEMRISNYLLWQISYSELWITDCFWPDFREPHLHEALKSFASRDRRFGGLKDDSQSASA